MTVLVDASAIVAIILDEPGSAKLVDLIAGCRTRITNGVALWEASRAVARGSRFNDLSGSLAEVHRYCATIGITVVSIAEREAMEAVSAQQRYGKGTGHPAQLNMGDCFAYACARTNGARLLYKGDDFSHTDLG